MSLAEKKFYIGTDSGGTKVEMIMVDESGKILKKFKYKGIHYSVAGPLKYSETLIKYILAAVKRSGLKFQNCLGICIGLAGARELSDRKKLEKLFAENLKFNKVHITSDAMTALIGAFEGGDGIILISGTGTVLYGYYNNQIKRIGGWGRVIGDEGGGYWIGKKALSIAAKEYDVHTLKKKESSLCRKLDSEFGINKENINDKVFKENFEIQKIAPLVLKLAYEGSVVCRKIIDEAVSDLVYLINSYLEFVKPKREIGIALIGSLVENDNILSRKLKKEITKLKNLKIVDKKHSPSYGAYLMISKKSNLINKV